MPETSTVALAFFLTLIAGLATGIGSVIALFAKRTNTRFLSIALGFSAGVMIYVSFVELLPQGMVSMGEHLGDGKLGNWSAVAAFFAGILVIGLIDKLIPSSVNPHELKHGEDVVGLEPSSEAYREHDYGKLRRAGLLTALAIAIHNFPEGIATFTAALSDPALGVAIAVAISIHNIPEGIAVAVPIYYATGNRKKAFVLSFLSGLAEPFGALVGYIVLMPFFSKGLSGALFGGIAGIMVYISLDELLPAAEEYGEHHLCIYGLIAGMGVMALSLLLMM